MTEPLDIVILGLSITSSWGNGHATTFRSLVKALSARGHKVSFFERDVPWYAENRDLPNPQYVRVYLYRSVAELKQKFCSKIRKADLCIVGSYVPDGAEIGEWVTRFCKGVKAFYDIDTPVTLAKLKLGHLDYLNRKLVPRYDLYLSFTGGPTLSRIERELGAPRARPLYCSVDPKSYFPETHPTKWDLGYMGTYSADRQQALETFLLEPAKRLTRLRTVVAGPMYPKSVLWPRNVERIQHLEPAAHRAFYTSQKYTLNVTRADMVAAGYSPSVRLFEAAACGTPIITDCWSGLETFFVPGEEILTAYRSSHVIEYLHDLDEEDRLALGERARRKVLAHHTALARAEELEHYVYEVSTPTKSPQPTSHIAGAIA